MENILVDIKVGKEAEDAIKLTIIKYILGKYIFILIKIYNMKRYSKSRRQRHKRSHHIKKGGSNYTSAATYAEYVNGSGNEQYARTLDQSGPYADRAGNIIVGAQGQWAQQPNSPTQQNLSLIQSAGKSRKRRGGFLGPVINQAIVPFGILGLQQTYGRKKRGGKTHRHKRRH